MCVHLVEVCTNMHVWQKVRNYGYLLASSSFIATSFELSTDGSFLESAENEWDLKHILLPMEQNLIPLIWNLILGHNNFLFKVSATTAGHKNGLTQNFLRQSFASCCVKLRRYSALK